MARLNDISRVTGIPVPTLRRAERGEAKLSPLSRSRLRNYYRREKYHLSRKSGLTAKESRTVSSFSEKRLRNYLQLRKSGGMIAEARDYSTLPKTEVREISDRLLSVARTLARNNHVRLSHILKGMSYSDRTVDDWDLYIKKRKQESWIPIQKVKGRYTVVSPDSKRYQRWLSSQKDRGR